MRIYKPVSWLVSINAYHWKSACCFLKHIFEMGVNRKFDFRWVWKFCWDLSNVTSSGNWLFRWDCIFFFRWDFVPLFEQQELHRNLCNSRFRNSFCLWSSLGVHCTSCILQLSSIKAKTKVFYQMILFYSSHCILR